MAGPSSVEVITIVFMCYRVQVVSQWSIQNSFRISSMSIQSGFRIQLTTNHIDKGNGKRRIAGIIASARLITIASKQTNNSQVVVDPVICSDGYGGYGILVSVCDLQQWAFNIFFMMFYVTCFYSMFYVFCTVFLFYHSMSWFCHCIYHDLS